MARRHLRLALLGCGLAAVVLLLAASRAQASGVLGSGIGPNVGPNLNPLPSIGELLNAVVNGLFGALLSALTPDFLKHADIHTLEWLVALPNPADTALWPHVGQLEANMVWVAGAMLPTTLIVAAARDTALSLSFRAHPGNALLRVVGAVFWLILYRFGVQNGVAFVNVLTHTMLSWPVVAQGLHRTVLVMFGGSVIFGAGGAFLGLLGLIALVFAVCLFALKVLLVMVLAILFVAGPLLIALTPLPAIGHLAQGWLLALVGVCLIPIGWCIIFATAGAISLDVTNLGGGAHIGGRIVGAFAALVTFYIAFKWPLMVLGHVRGALGALGVRVGAATGGAGAPSDGALATKAQRARTRLHAAMLAGGRGIGLAAGALGAPRGGLAGLAGRAAQPHLASAAATGAVALGAPRARPRPRSAGGRVARASEVLRETPARMRDAWRAAGDRPETWMRNGGRGASRRRRVGGRGRAGRPKGAAASATGAARTPPGSGRRESGRAKRPPVVPGTAGRQPTPRAGANAGMRAREQVSSAAQPPQGSTRPTESCPNRRPAASERRSRPAEPDPRTPRPAPRPSAPARPPSRKETKG